jgi:hypothetical protein
MMFFLFFFGEDRVLTKSALKVKQKMKILQIIFIAPGAPLPPEAGCLPPGATAPASEQAQVEFERDRRLNTDTLEIRMLGIHTKFVLAAVIRLDTANTAERCCRQRSPISTVNLGGGKTHKSAGNFCRGWREN